MGQIPFGVIKWLELIWAADLQSNSKYLCAYLRTFMNDKNDMAWPSYARIIKETGLSRQTISRHFDQLEKEGWLFREKGNSMKTTTYFASIPDKVSDEILKRISSEGRSLKELRSSPVVRKVVPQSDSNIQPLNKQSNKQLSDYTHITDQYHAFCTKLKPVKKLTDSRKKHINARSDLLKTNDSWTDYFKAVASIDFLNGINDYPIGHKYKDWKADIDWLINETNMIKVLEGKFKNKNKPQQTTTYKPMPKPGE